MLAMAPWRSSLQDSRAMSISDRTFLDVNASEYQRPESSLPKVLRHLWAEHCRISGLNLTTLQPASTSVYEWCSTQVIWKYAFN